MIYCPHFQKVAYIGGLPGLPGSTHSHNRNTLEHAKRFSETLQRKDKKRLRLPYTSCPFIVSCYLFISFYIVDGCPEKSDNLSRSNFKSFLELIDMVTSWLQFIPSCRGTFSKTSLSPWHVGSSLTSAVITTGSSRSRSPTWSIVSANWASNRSRPCWLVLKMPCRSHRLQ